MLLCTMVLHLALVLESVLFTEILLQWCSAKILLHLILYPNNSITNGNWSQNIVSHWVLDQAIVLWLVQGQTLVLYLVLCPRWCKPALDLVPGQTIVLHLVSQMQDSTQKTHGQMIVLHLGPCKHIEYIIWNR